MVSIWFFFAFIFAWMIPHGLFCGLGFMLAVLQILPMWRVKLWNKKEKKKPTVFLTSLFIFFLFILLFCIVEIPEFRFVQDFIGFTVASEKTDNSFLLFGRLLGIIIALVLCSFYFSILILNALDGIFTKRKEIVLIQCHATRIGHVYKWYYLEGIHNGKHYHFKMTRKMYGLLRRQTAVELTARCGIFGGIYIKRTPQIKG